MERITAAYPTLHSAEVINEEGLMWRVRVLRGDKRALKRSGATDGLRAAGSFTRNKASGRGTCNRSGSPDAARDGRRRDGDQPLDKESEMSHTAAHSAMSADMKKCSEECLSCSTICTETIHHCLHMGGKHVESAHLTTLLDCADICHTSANFLLRGSSLHKETCRTCAAVCRSCEASCRELEGEEMKRCADACARCAESCERMAAMAS